MPFRTSLAVVLLSILFTGCGGGDQPQADEGYPAEEEVSSPPNQPTPQADASAAATPLGPDDIERWQRGMEAELQAVREAEAALNQAQNSEDTLNAMMAANDMSTLEAGARAAGVSQDRYQFIRSNLSTAAGYLSPLEQEMDVSQMPPAMVEQFEQNRQTSLERMGDVLPPEVLEALRPRAAELRRQDVALTQARLRAVGMGG